MNGIHSCQGAGYTDSRSAFCTHLRDHISKGIQVHVFMRSKWCFFSVIQAARLTIREAIDHESATPQVPGEGVGDRQSQFCSHHGIEGIASLIHYFNPDGSCFLSSSDDHRFVTNKSSGLRGDKFGTTSC